VCVEGVVLATSSGVFEQLHNRKSEIGAGKTDWLRISPNEINTRLRTAARKTDQIEQMKRPEGNAVFRQTLRISRKLANFCLSGLAELKVAFFLVLFFNLRHTQHWMI